MKEIKYQAWDTKDKRMIEWQELLDYGSGLAEYFKNPRELIFREFTGLHDKNGKEIYEGDIVRMGTRTWGVFWDEDWTGFSLDDNEEILGLGQAINEDDEEVEVIGNIWENPELSEVKP